MAKVNYAKVNKMKLIFKNNWKIHKKSGAVDFLYIIWSFGKPDFNPRWMSITILNFEFGFEIWERK